MYSVDAGKVVSFPRFRGTNSAPAWSPDGTQLMFSSSMQGTPDLYVSDSNGSPKRLTLFQERRCHFAHLNPKTGQSVVFVSDRGGIPKLHMMNADGTNLAALISRQGYLYRPCLVSQRPNRFQLALTRRELRISMSWSQLRSTSSITPDSGSRNERPAGS
jgi:TolB protein